MYIMIIKMNNHTRPKRTCFNFGMFDWSGKNGEESGKSKKFDILCRWQPCMGLHRDTFGLWQ